MKAPFPWFGGKSRAADLIWRHFGDVPNYVEPFAGSLAVLLSRPHYPFTGNIRTETVNDADCYLSNFWRAVSADPAAVARHADNPVNEADLHARHAWLLRQARRVERTKSDPDYYDAKIAGYWVWGLSCWIGDGFCNQARPKKKRVRGKTVHRADRQLPSLGENGKGVNRKLPHLVDHGKGVNRALHEPEASGLLPGGRADRAARLTAYFGAIADRLRGVRVCCGDWSRVLGPSVTHKLGVTAVLLDPPYDVAVKRAKVYGARETGLWPDVCAWVHANGQNPLLRIALCGYAGTWTPPPGFTEAAWSASGGYGNQRAANRNRHLERIWFSPACLRQELDLFAS